MLLSGKISKSGSPDIENIIMYSVAYEEVKKRIADKIRNDYREAQEYVDELMFRNCRVINDVVNNWN